ncbi:hypothetical protein DdX_03347 [Ditylenchus destructor]|uniref:Uncharacterized protein n=1 Tax=Ditylenchus destructor TaxID=166010 RepID=A0AAD4NCW7_9BILA|nr:hypothetical protein DdX_03347 [Ditylenchus destructor]
MLGQLVAAISPKMGLYSPAATAAGGVPSNRRVRLNSPDRGGPPGLPPSLREQMSPPQMHTYNNKRSNGWETTAAPKECVYALGKCPKKQHLARALKLTGKRNTGSQCLMNSLDLFLKF